MNVASLGGEKKLGSPQNLVRRYTWCAFFCTLLALTSILALGRWGAVRDFERDRESLLRAEVAEAASHAHRTVRQIERDLFKGGVRSDLGNLHDAKWLLAYWRQAILGQEKCAYAAVEDRHGRIVAHSNPALEGHQLSQSWYERIVPEAGAHVVETRFSRLTEGRRAFDVQVPITLGDAAIGAYHAGISVDWFEASVAQQQEYARSGWVVVIGGTAVLVLAAIGSLYLVGRQTAALRQSLELSEVRRVNELTQLVVGLAHEVRNPLNAVRLNLHAISRVHRGEARLASEEIATILRESTREVGRVTALITEMLGYARSEPPREEDVDLNAEVRAALDLVGKVMEDCQVAVVARLSQQPVAVRIDRDRLRQILLNLLNNAREAVGKGGRIEVDVSRGDDDVTLAVSDNGPGIPGEQRQRIFEPFFTTKDVGIGLGLPLVKKFVDESGGTIFYDGDFEGGGRFVVRLPPATSPVEQAISV